jgi:hypothetical protein
MTRLLEMGQLTEQEPLGTHNYKHYWKLIRMNEIKLISRMSINQPQRPNNLSGVKPGPLRKPSSTESSTQGFSPPLTPTWEKPVSKVGNKKAVLLPNEQLLTSVRYSVVNIHSKTSELLSLTNYRMLMEGQTVTSVPYGYIQEMKRMDRIVRFQLKTGTTLELVF